MQEENKDNLLVPIGGPVPALDVRRDYQYAPSGADDGQRSHLRDYWRIIRRRLWVPLSAVFVIGTLTTIMMLQSPLIHEGKTTIKIDRERSVLDVKEPTLVSDDSQYINTELQILRLRETAYGVAKELDLAHNRKFLPDKVRSGNDEQTISVTSGETDVRVEMAKLTEEINTLLRNMDAARQRETRLVNITYRHQDPDLARQIADKWAEVYTRNHLDSRQEGSRTAARELEKHIGEVRAGLAEATNRLINYREQQNVLDFGKQEDGNSNNNIVMARLVDLHKQWLQAESDRKISENAYAISKEATTEEQRSKLPEVQRDLHVIDLSKKLADLRDRRAKLLVQFTEDWPPVVELNKQIEVAQGEMRAAQERILGGIENQLQSAKQREAVLDQDVKKQFGEAKLQDKGALTARMLQQQVDTYQTLLNKLYQSQKEMEVSSASQSNNVRIMATSAAPEVVGPQRKRNIILSLLLSLVAGVALVLFIDYLNNKIESAEDIDHYLHLPALGVIPIFPLGKARKRLGGLAANKELATAKVNGNGGHAVNGSNGAMILTEVESTSSIAESYRQLRTAVLLSSAEHAPRTILFTSSQPAEGKTTTSVNMAISLAQTGSSVLIVDADLRRPRVHKIFGLKNTRGLCNYLAGDCDFSSLIQVALPNLYVLPVGPLPPNPAELLGSLKMRQVVEMLSQNFDYVLIDSPPVASFADSLILSSMVEGVIIVVKSGFTSREMAQRTKFHLQSVGAKILGVVINHIKLQPHDYYYYSTYYSRYYYQQGGEGDDADVERETQATAKNA